MPKHTCQLAELNICSATDFKTSLERMTFTCYKLLKKFKKYTVNWHAIHKCFLSLIKKLKYLDPRQSWRISSEYTFISVIIYPMHLYISVCIMKLSFIYWALLEELRKRSCNRNHRWDKVGYSHKEHVMQYSAIMNKIK